ncbi:unnamed protein product [Ambrosiozyma monospora]|uniref:Unnamed protein product n=1 Tax=Ambrosiozyma monospora TaxID=43982 RepID=A0A9W7DGM9_AMBMO|nr:unnamed protein product [Ambrosiozyma monospora]
MSHIQDGNPYTSDIEGEVVDLPTSSTPTSTELPKPKPLSIKPRRIFSKFTRHNSNKKKSNESTSVEVLDEPTENISAIEELDKLEEEKDGSFDIFKTNNSQNDQASIPGSENEFQNQFTMNMIEFYLSCLMFIAWLTHMVVPSDSKYRNFALMCVLTSACFLFRMTFFSLESLILT